MFRPKHEHETEEEYQRLKRRYELEQRQAEDSDIDTATGILGAMIAAEVLDEPTPSVPDSTGDSSPTVDTPSADPGFGGFDGGASGGGGASGDF